MGDIIGEMPELGWAGRGAVPRHSPRDRPFPFRGGALSPTPLPNPAGWDGPRPSAWLGASSLRNVVVGAGD